ncbi:MAG: DUF5703 domain-containing protein [Clostridia bacterium]
MKREYIFTVPGKGEVDSVPIGNGDIGAMVWGEQEGRISIIISKTDSFSSALRLLKIGGVDLGITGGTYRFIRQKLDITNGFTSLEYSDGKSNVDVMIWVDANNPCIRIRITSDSRIRITAAGKIWRTEDVRIEGGFANRTPAYADFFGQDNDTEPIIVYKDKVCGAYGDSVMWYHRNPDSHYLPSLRFQNLEDLSHLYNDPLKDRIFGACIQSKEMQRVSETEMESIEMKESHDICIGVETMISQNEEAYCRTLHGTAAGCLAEDYSQAYEKHRDYWNEFNEKSYIRIKGDEKAGLVDSGYAIQRYMNACGGRGEFPIKFNGSIFVPDIHGDEKLGPDYRRWGGGYWFQNTRLMYWSMLASGDYDLMKPFFDMYEKSFELMRAKVRKHLGFDGVLYPETMSPWGTARNLCYSLNREGLNDAFVGNPYIKYYFSGMLELLVIMIEYVKQTDDSEFESRVLHKQANAIISFYKNLYTEKDKDGKIAIYPSQALETWQDAKNPTDAVAGLRYVLEELLEMATADRKLLEDWREFYETIPELPVFRPGGHPGNNKPCMIKPAEEYDNLSNVENPELYAVFPYRLVSFEKDNRNMGIENFRRRALRMNWGWTQDGIQAAVLGLPKEAREVVSDKFSSWNEKCRFQGYWGPNFDWISDQCHGSSAMTALQKMLLQCKGDKIYLFPGWPSGWDVDFKLHAYGNTTVECSYAEGKIKSMRVDPEERAADVVICFDRQIHTLY